MIEGLDQDWLEGLECRALRKYLAMRSAQQIEVIRNRAAGADLPGVCHASGMLEAYQALSAELNPKVANG